MITRTTGSAMKHPFAQRKETRINMVSVHLVSARSTPSLTRATTLDSAGAIAAIRISQIPVIAVSYRDQLQASSNPISTDDGAAGFTALQLAARPAYLNRTRRRAPIMVLRIAIITGLVLINKQPISARGKAGISLGRVSTGAHEPALRRTGARATVATHQVSVITNTFPFFFVAFYKAIPATQACASCFSYFPAGAERGVGGVAVAELSGPAGVCSHFSHRVVRTYDHFGRELHAGQSLHAGESYFTQDIASTRVRDMSRVLDATLTQGCSPQLHAVLPRHLPCPEHVVNISHASLH